MALSGRRKYRYHYHLTFGLLSTDDAIVSLSNSRFCIVGVPIRGHVILVSLPPIMMVPTSVVAAQPP
jgi:hypothetical protein